MIATPYCRYSVQVHKFWLGTKASLPEVCAAPLLCAPRAYRRSLDLRYGRIQELFPSFSASYKSAVFSISFPWSPLRRFSILSERKPSIDTHSGSSVATPSKHGSTVYNRIHHRHPYRRCQGLQRCVSFNIKLERCPEFVTQHRLGNGYLECLPCAAEALPFEKRNCTKV